MTISRRSFLSRSAGAASVLLGLPGCDAGTSTEALSADVLVNHVGFTPSATKFCLLAGAKSVPFDIVEKDTGRVVHHGQLEPRKGDLGDYLSADISSVAQPGTYEVRAGVARSGAFVIAKDVYLPGLRAAVDYFQIQRCGDSKTGYQAPCHLDDGVRKDNGKRQDVVGGWHDACDVRRWVDATLYGMTGLSRVLDVIGPGQLDPGRIIDEMRWGNRYFLRMQEPAGYVMHHCGGDQGNAFTDNQIGTKDDRVIDTQPSELPGQFHFIAAQAAMVRHVREVDPAYARTCQTALSSALGWCTEQRVTKAASLAMGIVAASQVHRAMGGDRMRALARDYAGKLLRLQVKGPEGAPPGERGFFLATAERAEPLREIMDGNLPLLALCEMLETFPDHADAPKWRDALRLHVDHLAWMSDRSVFGTIPFGLYTGDDPGGGRKVGKHWYRWFMKRQGEYRDDDWWVGINAHLASNGVGLARAARLLNDPKLTQLAQRQLDWILGVNPFNASTIWGFGRNQPRLFVTGEFKPSTPTIPGGVMNGIGGTDADAPALESGSYNTCEYWTPMVGYTMWLLAELHVGHRDQNR